MNDVGTIGITTLFIASALIFYWLFRDVQKQRKWKDEKLKKMNRARQRIAERERAEAEEARQNQTD